MRNCIGVSEFEMFDNWDKTATRDFFLSASRCVVGSSSIIKFRFDAPRRLAIPNLKDNATLTFSPPLSDSKSNSSVFELHIIENAISELQIVKEYVTNLDCNSK